MIIFIRDKWSYLKEIRCGKYDGESEMNRDMISEYWRVERYPEDGEEQEEL
jgi:hypothetical protein